jgi:hypothetical protein
MAFPGFATSQICSEFFNISNEGGPVKSVLLLFLFLAHTPTSAQSRCFLWRVMRRNSRVVLSVQPTGSVRVTSSTRCGPPNISPITLDHDD